LVKFLARTSVQTRSGVHPAFYSKGTGRTSKTTGLWSQPLTSNCAEVKNACSYTFTSTCAFI